LAFIVLLLVIAGALWWPRAVQASYPQIDGEIDLAGLDAPVDIYRDQQGIPHIYASSEHDLFFAQGYVHAQDRFWQMDLNRHASAGRLSELVGSAGVDTDQFLRTLGWERVARQELEMLSEDAIAVLEAYAEGVNAYLTGRSNQELGLEYAFLPILNRGYQPKPWEPLHTQTWAKAMAWDLRDNMNAEIDRAILLSSLTPEQINALYPPYPADQPTIVTGQAAPASSAQQFLLAPNPEILAGLEVVGGRYRALDALLGGGGDKGIGSNSWAVSGQLSASGMPLLANDPHLNHGIPHIWYQNGLHCQPKGPQCSVDMAGFSFVGAPGVIIGHNDRIAWGFTNVGADVMDLYIEKINPENPNQYEYNGEWVDMEIVTETINVGSGDPIELEARITRHGPIISDVYGTLEDFTGEAGVELPENYAIAVQWTALQPNLTLQAVLQLGRAQNFEEFRAAASGFAVPAQNLLYADVEGNIGYQMPGWIPIRDGDNDGRYPVPGWTGEFEWLGFIAFDQLPFLYNPPEGYIVTANNAVVGADYPFHLADTWAYGYRAQRIVDMIEAAPGPIDLAYFQQMQADNRNLNAETLVPVLEQILPENDLVGMLAGWDFQNNIDSPEAALFEVFWKHLVTAAFGDDLPEDMQPSGGGRWWMVMENILTDSNNPWWDDQTTPDAVETRDDIFRSAFEAAVTDIEDRLGSDPAGWAWGDLHLAYFEHSVMTNFPLINTAFNRGPFQAAGGSSIVNASNWDASEDDFRISGSSSSFRMIVDLGDWQNSLTVFPTGQSGHPDHPHYIDLVDLWRLVRYYPMHWELDAIEAAAEGHLRLTP
jgi:penicillin amidase